jgi:hypothetical protein
MKGEGFSHAMAATIGAKWKRLSAPKAFGAKSSVYLEPASQREDQDDK